MSQSVTKCHTYWFQHLLDSIRGEAEDGGNHLHNIKTFTKMSVVVCRLSRFYSKCQTVSPMCDKCHKVWPNVTKCDQMSQTNHLLTCHIMSQSRHTDSSTYSTPSEAKPRMEETMLRLKQLLIPAPTHSSTPVWPNVTKCDKLSQSVTLCHKVWHNVTQLLIPASTDSSAYYSVTKCDIMSQSVVVAVVFNSAF